MFVITGCTNGKKQENATTPLSNENVTSQTEEFKNDNYYRLSLGHANEEEIESGVKKLTAILLGQGKKRNQFFIRNIN